MIFKKGDPALCENYWPISLLSASLKVFGAMMKRRLLDAGVDDQLLPSQFGFRANRSTEDAIFIVRRRIELASARKNGRLSLLALDWKRAFDSVNITSLGDALRRFGIPQAFINLVLNFMRNRKFYVEEFGAESNRESQDSGVSQGCTLSPLLFLIVMNVLMCDAIETLSPEAKKAYETNDLAELVYADDTLLMSVSDAHRISCGSGTRRKKVRHGTSPWKVSVATDPL